jgi:hypothetical protein
MLRICCAGGRSSRISAVTSCAKNTSPSTSSARTQTCELGARPCHPAAPCASFAGRRAPKGVGVVDRRFGTSQVPPLAGLGPKLMAEGHGAHPSVGFVAACAHPNCLLPGSSEKQVGENRLFQAYCIQRTRALVFGQGLPARRLASRTCWQALRTCWQPMAALRTDGRDGVTQQGLLPGRPTPVRNSGGPRPFSPDWIPGGPNSVLRLWLQIW